MSRIRRNWLPWGKQHSTTDPIFKGSMRYAAKCQSCDFHRFSDRAIWVFDVDARISCFRCEECRDILNAKLDELSQLGQLQRQEDGDE